MTDDETGDEGSGEAAGDETIRLLERLKAEVAALAKGREEFAHQVRQLMAQRTRLETLIQVIGAGATFGSRQPVSAVAGAMKASNAQFFQDVFCLALNGGKRNGFFVEFGACDGRIISNSWILERDFGWTGILCEPGRVWHDDLKANRTCTIDTRCVWNETGATLSFEELAETDRSSIAGLERLEVETPTSSYDVETVSLVDLLDQHGAPEHIDLLSIDVEGAEVEVLQTFPFDRYSFGFICVEHHKTHKEEAVRAILEAAGYSQIFRHASGFDGFYVPQAGDGVRP